MNTVRYARYIIKDGVTCYENLDDHLSLAAFVASLLYIKIFGFRYDKEVLLYVALAGLLHDIAKALNVYHRLLPRGRLSFSNPPHEEVSAAIARTMILESRVRICKVLGKDVDIERLEKLVIRPISNHHQGLRMLTLEERSSISYNLKKDDVIAINNVIKSSINKLLGYVERFSPYIPEDLIKLTKRIPDLGLELKNSRLRRSIRIDMGAGEANVEDQISLSELSRIVTGILIAADYIATEVNLLKINSRCLSSTRLSREILNLTRALGLHIIAVLHTGSQ